MRVFPEIDIDHKNLFLTRWDQYTPLNPCLCCETCKWFVFDEQKYDKKCNNPENIRNECNTDLYFAQTDVYLCGLHEINKRIKPYIKDNPYIIPNDPEHSLVCQQYRDKLEKEIDIRIDCKRGKGSIEINDINKDKIQIGKTFFRITGYVCDSSNFSIYVDNLLAKRTKSTIEITPRSVETIQVWQNGNRKSCSSIQEFIDFVKDPKFN